MANTQKYLNSRGLNDLPPETHRQVENIIYDLMGNGLMKAGMALSFAKAEEQLKVSYLSALIEQNWILMNQNQRIMDRLDKIIDLSMTIEERIEEKEKYIAGLRKELQNEAYNEQQINNIVQLIVHENSELDKLKSKL